MKNLSNLEFVILSLVAEKPVHGYQMEQIIEQRGIRVWTDIGFSSIYYVLRKLESAGYLTSLSEAAGERPARKYYTITPNGSEIFHGEVLDRLSFPRLHTGDFDLALGCLPVLSDDEIISSLQGLKQRLAEQIPLVSAKQDPRDSDMGSHVPILFDHMLSAMKAELDWISRLLNKLENKNVN
jgi:DNA-binding PadR family transcriptional regulator